jgi:hypothetical protein
MDFHRLKLAYILLSITALLLMPGPSSAQDAHYWTLQYGTRAELLGGLVVGSIKDLSSTFYNPGAVAFSTDQSLLFTTDAFEISNLNIHIEDNLSVDLSDTKATKAPGMFAIRFPFEVIGGNQLSLSYLTRQQFELNLSNNHVNSWWDPGWGSGDESITSEFKFDEQMQDTWVGVSWAKTVSDSRMALGATLFGAYRSQNTRIQTILQGKQVGGPGASATFIRDYSFWNVRALLKVGASFDFRPLAFGVALTMPSISFFGDGNTFYNDSVVNLDLNGDDIRDSYLASNYQEGLSSTYRSPASIAIGTSYGYRTMTFHFSAEYFGRTDTYNILETEIFHSQTTGNTFTADVTGGMNEVFNFGIGLDHKFSEKFSIYGGLTTDRSGWRSDVNTTFTSWDLYHVTLGSAFKVFEIDWTIGMGFSWGGDDLDLRLDFLEDDGAGSVIGPDGITGTADYTKFKMILGFAFPTSEKTGSSGS